MYFLEVLKVIFLGIVQGITEWLPISSTGHMILVDEFLKLQQSDIFVSTFLVVVQFGSILAVILLYFRKLNPYAKGNSIIERRETFSLWGKVLVGIIPAGVLGVLFNDQIDALFFNAKTVATTLIIYGILFIVVERFRPTPRINSFSELKYSTIIMIGFFQALAMIPGTSRSGATIIGAMILGTSRTVAAEFSFFLAIPTMLGASALKLLKAGLAFSAAEWSLLFIGAFVAFIVSIFAIKFLMRYIQTHDFKVFGYYRIILGLIVLGYFYLF